MDALWEIQKVMDNPNSRIYIHVEGKEPMTISGFATADTYSFSTNAAYTEIADMFGAAASNIANKLIEALPGKIGADVTAALGAIEGINAAASLLGKGKTVAGSVKKWDGSTMQLPPLQLVFVALKPTDRPQDSMAKLLSMCMPGQPFAGEQSDKDLFFWAPNGYSPARVLENAVNQGFGYGGNIRGTCTVRIGQWFEAYGLLPEVSSFEASKETTKLGNPLYVTGTVTFTTYRDLKASEYNNLFLKNS